MRCLKHQPHFSWQNDLHCLLISSLRAGDEIHEDTAGQNTQKTSDLAYEVCLASIDVIRQACNWGTLNNL